MRRSQFNLMRKNISKSKYAQVAEEEFARYLMALEAKDIRVGNEALSNLKKILNLSIDEVILNENLLEDLFYIGEIDYNGKTFCFTGVFEYGERKVCESAITDKGGKIAKRVTRDLDYLIVGSDFSPSWKQTGYGNKIERALEIKQDGGTGAKPLIIHESKWIQSFNK